MLRSAILSTASEPQVLHRPWVSNVICVRQLTHNHCFSIGFTESLPPSGWPNMLLKGSNGGAKWVMRAVFPSDLCSVGHKQPCRKRWTCWVPDFEVLKTDFMPRDRRTGDSK
jgi:hypothetical protein